MKLPVVIAMLVLLLPVQSMAATGPSSFSVGRSFVVASSSPGNAYFAGASIVSSAQIVGDLFALGGSIVTTAPIQGDGLLLAGSVNSRAAVQGDLRVVGGSVSIDNPIRGDLIAAGFSVHNTERVQGSVFIIAAETQLTGGATGPVTIYGNDIALAGNFADNVTIVSTGKITIAEDTTIVGTLTYQAPEPAVIPASATVGAVAYTTASYLPDPGTSRVLAVAGLGLFLLVRILGALILTGLLAGLFPKLAVAVVERAYTGQPRNVLLTMLLGFAILVTTPVMILLLTFTFVGIGLAFILLILYALLSVLAFLYAGIILGSMCVRRFLGRETILWHDGVLGMFVLSLITLVPVGGSLVAFFLIIFAAGALLQIFFQASFPRDVPQVL